MYALLLALILPLAAVRDLDSPKFKTREAADKLIRAACNNVITYRYLHNLKPASAEVRSRLRHICENYIDKDLGEIEKMPRFYFFLPPLTSGEYITIDERLSKYVYWIVARDAIMDADSKGDCYRERYATWLMVRDLRTRGYPKIATDIILKEMARREKRAVTSHYGEPE